MLILCPYPCPYPYPLRNSGTGTGTGTGREDLLGSPHGESRQIVGELIELAGILFGPHGVVGEQIGIEDVALLAPQAAEHGGDCLTDEAGQILGGVEREGSLVGI